jgi:hypothetical protein
VTLVISAEGLVGFLRVAMLAPKAVLPGRSEVTQALCSAGSASASVNRDPPLHDRGCGQLAQVGGKKGVSVDACKTPSSGAVHRRSPESSLLSSASI